MRFLASLLLALSVSGAAGFMSPALVAPKAGLPQASSRQCPANAALTVTMMGKGKGVPMNMRGNANKMREQQQMRDQMMGDDSDGFPVFTIYVRSTVGKVWYPCGSLKGDQRSKSLVESWRDNALFLKDQYKSTLDKGMAKSVFDQKDQFMQSVYRLYPQLKKSSGDIEFAYKVRILGIEKKFEEEGRSDELKMTMLTEDMTGSLLDSMKNMFGA